MSYTDYLRILPEVIRGVLVDEATGEPVCGAAVYLIPGCGACETDCNGSFSLFTWINPPVSIMAAHRDYITARFQVRRTSVPLLLKIKSNKNF